MLSCDDQLSQAKDDTDYMSEAVPYLTGDIRKMNGKKMAKRGNIYA